MKRVETDLNERFLRDNLTPSPLYTRIGINSGDMVVGNLGTERQMDYTIMGHAVNLAARLEGVNKQYGSSILVSEETRRLAGDRFLFRRLDRVRVVGVRQPVQLYELLDERDAASAKLVERVDAFEQAIEAFRAHDFAEAGRIFAEVAEAAPDDTAAKRYAQRCEQYKTNPPPAGWDGVYKLGEK
ncbi:MAG: adenylate/guanylate cyclase domain-containing protein, partial [Spirochaetales bacterium]